MSLSLLLAILCVVHQWKRWIDCSVVYLWLWQVKIHKVKDIHWDSIFKVFRWKKEKKRNCWLWYKNVCMYVCVCTWVNLFDLFGENLFTHHLFNSRSKLASVFRKMTSFLLTSYQWQDSCGKDGREFIIFPLYPFYNDQRKIYLCMCEYAYVHKREGGEEVSWIGHDIKSIFSLSLKFNWLKLVFIYALQ